MVFEATVESIERLTRKESQDFGGTTRVVERRMTAVRLKDVRHLLGEGATVVLTGTGGGDCGYEKFRVGRRFVIHARPTPEGLTTSTCSFTAPVEEAGEVLEYIESLSRESPGARVTGKAVMVPDQLLGPRFVRSPPLEGVRVTLDGPARRTATTGPDGMYTFEALPPGRYRVSLATDASRSLVTWTAPEFVLPHAHACATPHTEFHVDGTIHGSVVDIAGRPVAKAAVALRLADGEGKSTWATTQAGRTSSDDLRFSGSARDGT